MSEDDDTKEHAPSQKKLDDARARGDVPLSADLTAAAALGGALLAVLAFGPAALVAIGSAGVAYLGQIDRTAGPKVGADPWGVGGWVLAIAAPVWPLFLLPALCALLAVLGQRGLTFSADKLMPKWSRLNPIANAKRRFGGAGLFDFGKSSVKLLLVGGLLGWFGLRHLPQILLSAQLEAPMVTVLLMDLIRAFLILICGITVAIGGLDYLWQHFDHIRRNRMSRQEMVDEYRESEGDPHMKGQRRQRALAIATNRMLADVPKADVVLVNPTHYAVALKWNRASGRAPICLAKGTDAVAARIREAAQAAGVPIHSDPPTARALYASIDIGREINPEHYAPVAAAIRYGERMRQRARDRRGF